MNRRRSTALFLALAALGCNSTGVGNPGQVDLALTSDSEPEPGATDPDDTVASKAIRHAVLVFSELRWLPCSSDEEPVVVPGPMVVDLVTSKVDPPLPSVAVPDGGFCGIDAPLTGATSPPSLTGRSVFFSGERADGALFILYADMIGMVKIRARSGIVWDADTAPALIWAFRPRRWIPESDLDSAESRPFAGTRRAIAIDLDRHPLLYAAVQNNMGERSSLYADLNHDGHLDDRERDDDNWLGEGLPGLD
jgi:hypothetical protein